MRVMMFALLAGIAVPAAEARADDQGGAWEFIGRAEGAAVEVRSRVAGQLARVVAREGDAVENGSLLAEVDPREYHLALEAARARLKVAETRLEGARLKEASARTLLEKHAIRQDELALATLATTEAKAAFLGVEAEARRAELVLSWTRLLSPIKGRVVEIRITEGALVTADQTRILTVLAADPLEVAFDVPEAILLRLRRDGLSEPGKLSATVGFVGEEGHPHAADTVVVASRVDPRTGTATFRATLPNPKGILVPGMTARVRLVPSAPAGKSS